MSDVPVAQTAAAPTATSGPIRTALLGWSLPVMAGLQEAGRPFVLVAAEDFRPWAEQNNVTYVSWDFGRLNEQSGELVQQLIELGVEVAVPLYEECVEWAGALNAHFRDDPRVFSRFMLFRDKGMMKRKALMSGIRVGVFEEVEGPERLRHFFRRVNQAQLKLAGEVEDPVHVKPLNAAGSVGHYMIRSEADIDKLEETVFPCLVESHLDGQEFSCEAFIHAGKVRFLNITEYIHLGYSNFVPASASLQARRPQIRKAIEQLVAAFGIEYGMIHPEYFLTPDGQLNFGEVAARIPGGHIFDLIKRAYGFDPYHAFVMCCDPETTDEELNAIFPAEDAYDGHAGCLMVYPKHRIVKDLIVPDALTNDAMFERHDLFPPMAAKVPDREGFGNHFGTVFVYGKDTDRMRKLLLEYEEHDFYV